MEMEMKKLRYWLQWLDTFTCYMVHTINI
jgi:hypothetical protein